MAEPGNDWATVRDAFVDGDRGRRGRAALARLETRLREAEAEHARLEGERDAIGAALTEPCAECGHIDWRSDGYLDDCLTRQRAWIVAEMDKARAIDAKHGDPWGGDSAIAVLHHSLGNNEAEDGFVQQLRAAEAEVTRLQEGLRHIFPISRVTGERIGPHAGWSECEECAPLRSLLARQPGGSVTPHDDFATLRQTVGLLASMIRSGEGITETFLAQEIDGKEALARLEAELARLERELDGYEEYRAANRLGLASLMSEKAAAGAEVTRLREKMEWVKHALPPSVSDELTEWLDKETP